MAWRRVGECPPERCQGRCCEHIGVWYDDTPDNRAFLKTLQIRGVRLIESGGKVLVDLPQRCQYLTHNGLCALHPDMKYKLKLTTISTDGVERPQFCSDWPQEPSQLINDPYCGYSFERVEEEVEAR